MKEEIKFRLEMKDPVVIEIDERIFQVEANKFCFGDPSKAVMHFSCGDDDNLTIYERILKRFFYKKYCEYMACMMERSIHRNVIRKI